MTRTRKNFYRNTYFMKKCVKTTDWDLNLKHFSEFQFWLPSAVMGSLTFKSADMAGYNDLNFAKASAFLAKLHRGVLSSQFRFAKPKKAKSAQYQKYSTEPTKKQMYNFVKVMDRRELIAYLGHFYFFLRPFAKLRQVSPVSSLAHAALLTVTFPDVTPFAAGAASLPLFYDYFDWQTAKIVIQLNTTSQKLFFIFSSLFRFGALNK